MLSVRQNLLTILALMLLIAGCAQKRISLPIEPGETILLDDTPFFAQEEYQCGPAALAMILGASGIDVHPEALAPLTYIPERHGSLQLELIGAARRYQRIPFEIEPTLNALIGELKAGRPVLVLQNYGLESLPVYHYAVVVGAEKDAILLRSGTTRQLHMGLSSFLMSWVRAGSWGIIALQPGELPVTTSAERYLKAVSGFEHSGHKSLSELAYRAALSRWPENSDILFALGNNANSQGKYKEAEVHFRTVLRTRPNHIAAANNLADTLLKRGCSAQAAAIIDKTLEKAEHLHSLLLPFIQQSQKEIKSSLDSLVNSRETTGNYTGMPIEQIICNEAGS